MHSVQDTKPYRPYRVASGIGAGAGAALVVILAMAALRFLIGFPTIPELLLNPVVTLLGGEAFSAALDRLYYAGRPLLFTIMLEGTLLLGVVLGVVYAWLARPDPVTGRRLAIFNSPLGGVLYGLFIGLLLNTLFLPIIGQPVFADRPYGIFAPTSLPLWLGLMALALIYGMTLQGLLPKVVTPVPVQEAVPGVPYLPAPSPARVHVQDRRQFLRIVSGTFLAVVGGVGFWLGGTILNQGPVDPRSGPDASDGSDDIVAQEPGDTPTPESVSQAQPTPEPPRPSDTPVPPEPSATPEPPATEAAVDVPTEIPTEVPTELPSNTPEPPPPPTATAEPLPVIKVSEITPTEKFYHVSKNFFDPSPSAEGWKLEIKGLVDNPYSLTYQELIALKAITVTTGMMCISNPIGGGLIGNTTWKGVRMADLLKKARVREQDVVDVVLRAVDDYSNSFRYQKAIDPDVMVVWEMEGSTLTSEHGFPARVLVPGIYGMKHVKWLTSIELVDHDYKGYWQQPSQGWSDPAPVNTMSRIDFPTAGTLKMGAHDISGIAFAGDRSISKVEISTDGGKVWAEAYVKPPKSGTSWIVWGYRWTPPQAGKYTLQVRATDGNGKVQVAKVADPFPDGATGYHMVTYTVN